MTMDWLNHSKASNLVRFWRAPVVGNYMNFTDDMDRPGFTLRFPGQGYEIAVYFRHVKDHPELMRIRSTNWRCEHEPNGIFRIEDCRRFYKTLVKEGFVAVS